MKSTVLWNMTPCSFIKGNQDVRKLLSSTFTFNTKKSTLPQFGKFPPDLTTSGIRRRCSSWSPARDPTVTLNYGLSSSLHGMGNVICYRLQQIQVFTSGM